MEISTSLEKEVYQRKKSIVVCIPAYNEEKNITKLIVDVKKFSDKIIVIDDGSTDHTPNIVRELGLELIRHEKNLGKGAALRAGFLHALTYSPDVVVTIDGDGQHNPSDIPKIIQPVIDGEVDVVIGSRSNKTKMPRYRKIGLDGINFLNRKAINSNIKDTQSGFRAYSFKSIMAIAPERFQDYSAEFEQIGMLTKKGFEIAEVPVDLNYHGIEKTSKKNFLTHGGELILASLFMIIARRPIIYLALPGTIFLLIGLFYAFYTLYLFNVDRYFSIPMTVIAGGMVILGSLLFFHRCLSILFLKCQITNIISINFLPELSSLI